jgi:hypothetical protein
MDCQAAPGQDFVRATRTSQNASPRHLEGVYILKGQLTSLAVVAVPEAAIIPELGWFLGRI